MIWKERNRNLSAAYQGTAHFTPDPNRMSQRLHEVQVETDLPGRSEDLGPSGRLPLHEVCAFARFFLRWNRNPPDAGEEFVQ
jgi:hypothetical protein